MKKHERADTDGEHDQGTDGTSSDAKASDDKSIAGHAADHPHAGHDGTQADPHSQPKHGNTHHDIAERHSKR